MKAICILFYLAISALLLMMVPEAIDNPSSQAEAILLLNYGVQAMVLLWVSVFRPQRLYLAVTAIFHFVFFAVVPLWEFHRPSASVNIPRLVLADEGYYGAVMLGALICLLVGYRIGIYSRWTVPIRLTSARIITSRLPYGVLFCVLGLALSSVGILIGGGPGILFASRSEFSEQAQNASSGIYVIKLTLIAAPVAYAGILILNRALVRKRVPQQTWIGLLVYLAIVAVTNNPILFARYWTGTVAGAIVFSIFYRRRPAAFRWIPGVAVLAILFLFPFLDVFRHSSGASIGERIRHGRGAIGEVLDKGDLDTYLQYAAIASVADKDGTDKGRQIMGSLLFFVPRAIWNDKPEISGAIIAENFGYTHKNISCPLLGEFYYAFGAVGATLGYLIFGILIATFDNTLVARSPRHESVIVPLLIGAPFLIFLYRGALLNAIAYCTVPLAFYSLMLILSRFVISNFVQQKRGQLIFRQLPESNSPANRTDTGRMGSR
ncbi:MAG: hypothetical protein AAGD07_01910 [Planctomycetota bacterium]